MAEWLNARPCEALHRKSATLYKGEYLKGYRGFESLSIRHSPQALPENTFPDHLLSL